MDAGGRGVVVVDGGAWGVYVEVLAVGCRYVRSHVIGCWRPYQTNTKGVIVLTSTTDHVMYCAYFPANFVL